jgi:hypothetical protein
MLSQTKILTQKSDEAMICIGSSKKIVIFPYFPQQSQKTSSSLLLHVCQKVLHCYMAIFA